MIHRIVALSFAASLLCLGCGGTSATGGGTGGSGGDNPYAGNYSGEYEDTLGNVGTFIVNVSSQGLVNGDFGPSSGGSSGGSSITNSFTGAVNNTGTGTIKIGVGSATLVFGSSGQTSLSAVTKSGPTTIVDQIASVSNPNGIFGGANPFTGDFGGTVSYPTLSKSGVVAMSIDAGGNITGTELVVLGASPTLGTIAGTISNAGVLNYTVTPPNPAASETLNGTVTLAAGKISGTLADTNGTSPTISVSDIQP